MSPDSSQGGERLPEFGRYRKAVGVAAVGITGLAVVWVAASVGVALWLHPRPADAGERFSGVADDRAGMLRCAVRLEQLLDEQQRLVGESIGASEPARTQARQSFGDRWIGEWRDAGARCRFAELRDRGLGAAYDRLAHIHDELGEVHRSDAALLENFGAHDEPRIEALRRGLQASRQTLASPSAGPSSGIDAPP